MAIDFGRMARGIATGYLGAKIANTEANDQMNANIIEQAGLNFYQDTLPKFQTGEKNRKVNYGKISAKYGKPVAEYLGQNNFITGDKTNFDDVVEMLGSNDGLNEARLNAYLEASPSSYEERATSRLDAIQQREKTIMGLTSGSSKIGNMTANLMIPESTPKSEQTITTPAVEGSQVGPVVTEDIPEKTETVKLPSYAEIFGDTSVDNSFKNLPREDQVAYQSAFDKQYKTKYINAITGLKQTTQQFKEDYDKLSEQDKARTTLDAYVYKRHFEENYLPSVGINVSSTKAEPNAVTLARNAINYNRSVGNDAAVEEARTILVSLGYDPNDYGL